MHDFWTEQLELLVEHVAHEARLDEIVDKFPVRDHMERRYLRLVREYGIEHPKSVEAQDALEGPAPPPALEYLLRWSVELYGRSGVGMSGLAPLSFTSIRVWATLMQYELEPYEVVALLRLDAVRMHPPKLEASRG